MDPRERMYHSQNASFAASHIDDDYGEAIPSGRDSLQQTRTSFDTLPNAPYDSSSISGIIADGSSTRPSSEEKIMKEDKEARLVIGLDYGTTYTGVAYVTSLGAHCELNNIYVQSDWGRGVTNDEKVPSVISYSNPQAEWGEALSANSVSMVHTKLELGLQDLLGELDMTLQVLDGMRDLNFSKLLLDRGTNDRPAYSHHSPEAIVTDYLTKVFEYVEQEIEAFGPVARKLTTTDLVVTVPTDWSYMAMNSTYRALTKAGFNQQTFPKLQDVMFITEPEAAALYTARELQKEFLEEGKYFILCDAGGGTVDVVSYKVTKLDPRLELEQIGKPTGKKCGSIFINLKFKQWLRKLLGDTNYRKLDPNMDIEKSAAHASETPQMRALMKKFDSRKRSFTPDSGDIRIDLPPPLQDLTIPENPSNDPNIPKKVDLGRITIKKSDMEAFFNACISEIAAMIKLHIHRIKELRQNRPKHLFLVGGFGESEYLQVRIANLLRRERLSMEFQTPEKSWTAVVRGAVVSGVEKFGNKALRYATPCRHSYAVCVDEIYTAEFHAGQNQVHIGGNDFAPSQLKWLLNKGDLVLSNEIHEVDYSFELRFLKIRQEILKFKVWRNLSSEEHRPTQLDNALDELDPSCELEIDTTKIKFERARYGSVLKPVNYQATLKLILRLHQHRLEASLWWNEENLSRKFVPY